MKIQCDVCEKEEASIYCCADEAALCRNCDRRVHHANKLAGKHHRLSLLHSNSSKDSPLCDICQEKRGFVFCQEDRAILCRECDNSIHKVNEHTQKHNRFLLSGVKVSPVEASFTPQTSTSSNGSETETNYRNKSDEIFRPISTYNNNNINDQTTTTTTQLESRSMSSYKVEDYRYESQLAQEYASIASVSTSSISEYLMETLPGWHVDDFLDPSNSSCGFYEEAYDCMSPNVENYKVEGNLGPVPSHDTVPQVSPLPYNHLHLYQTGGVGFGPTIKRSDQNVNSNNNNNNNSTKVGRKWSKDGSAVCDISTSTMMSKRTSW